AAGLVHRDVKPGNLWLEALPGGGERVKVLDFGLARSVRGSSRVTQQGDLIGTPAYMAPEQAAGRDVTERGDVYSLGLVLYHMLTGSNPFEREDLVSTLTAVALETPPAAHEVNPEVPEDLSALTRQLM